MIKTIEQLERVKKECKKLVTTRSALSAAAAAVPVPGVDLAADIGLITNVTNTINRKFGLSADQVDSLDPDTKQQVLVYVTSIGSNLIGKTVTKEMVIAVLKRVGVRLTTRSAAKYIPFVGTAIASSVSFGAMKWMGNSHIDECYDLIRMLIEAKDGQEPSE